jgi:hypothetical protein
MLLYLSAFNFACASVSKRSSCSIINLLAGSMVKPFCLPHEPDTHKQKDAVTGFGFRGHSPR